MAERGPESSWRSRPRLDTAGCPRPTQPPPHGSTDPHPPALPPRPELCESHQDSPRAPAGPAARHVLRHQERPSRRQSPARVSESSLNSKTLVSQTKRRSSCSLTGVDLEVAAQGFRVAASTGLLPPCHPSAFVIALVGRMLLHLQMSHNSRQEVGGTISRARGRPSEPSPSGPGKPEPWPTSGNRSAWPLQGSRVPPFRLQLSLTRPGSRTPRQRCEQPGLPEQQIGGRRHGWNEQPVRATRGGLRDGGPP